MAVKNRTGKQRKVTKLKKKPAGSSPGSVVYVGVDRNTPVKISALRYSLNAYQAQREITVDECRPGGEGLQWITVDGVHDVDLLTKIGERFSLHPLVVEDIGNTTQRPKIEQFDDYIFIAMKMITYNAETSEVRSEHVSIVFGQGFVLSFLEDAGDVFDPVRKRIESGKGRIRSMGSDYLVYALLDSIVDRYFDVIEGLGERIEELEEEVVTQPEVSTLTGIHKVKRELIYLRRSVWPVREIVNALIRDESHFVHSEVKLFLRDLYDHSIHVVDTIETLRDIVSGTLDVYLSSVSNKLNQVMKVLTVMSSIFIPLTFVAGVYGMNFHYMPELEWKWGYPTVMFGMFVLAVGLLRIFQRKQWL